MPTYYDETTKAWFCKFYYTDYTGAKKQKKKRGFKLQREAKKWETDFLAKESTQIDIPFDIFVESYLKDMATRLKPYTMQMKQYLIEKHIIPYFSNKRVNAITALDIRQWQNQLIEYRDIKGKGLSSVYLRKISAQMTAIFNYAVKYYDLTTNPCTKAGNIGNNKSKEMDIFTQEEFNKFIDHLEDSIDHAIFMTLFYTGMRKGELFALTVGDIDLTNGVINIDKSYQRIKKKNVITLPKTEKSIRKIEIPQFLFKVLQNHINSLYDKSNDTYLFMEYYVRTRGRLKATIKKANLKEIRIHDFRHSHASLLIELGYPPLLVADRLGDNIETTLRVYSHLYPNKQSEIVQQLEKIYNSTNLVPNE